ncbi:MAG TPA: hypothetical protein VLM19_05240 [Nitrospiraceae bacterium]|nr:hypothetical protein [Nitrospiraceae bacterium]
MTDEELRQNEINRAAQAQAVMKNPLVTEVLDLLEKDIIKAWEGTPMRDIEAREKAWMYYLTVKRFRNIFTTYIETGRMASMQLEQKKLFRIFGGR